MSESGEAPGPTRLTRLVPALGWLPDYDRRWLRGDVIAGIAVTALIVPKNLGYAGIAGIPLQNGLYAAAAGAIIYALFCTSRHISTGPSSSLAAVAGGAVIVTGVVGEDAAQLVAAIAVATGVLFLLLAIFRLGWIARFLSKAVVTGFLAGAAVDVVIGELPKLTGTEAEGDSAWRELATWIGSLGDTSGTTLLVLAPLFSDLPKAVLGAVIIDAVVFGMIDGAELKRLRRVARFDFWIAVAAILGVLSVDVLAGVVVGVALSLAWLIHVSTSPPMPLLSHEEGVAVVRLDGGLFFATAEALDDRVRELARREGLAAVVLNLEGVNFIDSQGAAKLAELRELLGRDGIDLRLDRVKPQVRSVLESDGFALSGRPRDRASMGT